MKNKDFIEDYFREIKNKKFLNYRKLHKKEFAKFKRDFSIQISKALNNLHKKKYSTKQWKILIGPWLNITLNIFFYYNFFINFFPKKLKKKIISTSLVKFYPPNDYIEFFKFINTKKYQIHFIKILILKNNYVSKVKNKNSFELNVNLKKLLYFKIIKLFSFHKTLFLIRSRLTISQIFLLICKSKFKILPLLDLTKIFRPSGLVYSKEKRLKFLSSFDKKFYHIAKFVTETIPSSYIENFNLYEKTVDKLLIKASSFYTDTSHLDDDLFKNLILRLSTNKNLRILIGQHGGNHRIHDQFVTNYHDDYDICSKYFVWGKPLKSKEVKISSTRLFNLRSNDKIINNAKYDVCYVFEAIRENQFQGDFKRNDDYIRSLDTKRLFFKNLKKNFIVKSYYEKNRYDEQISDKKLSKYLDISIKLFKNNKKVLYESNLIVFDYMSTMIFELISLNIPFVLILENSEEYLSKFGRKFIEDLKKINLFFSSSYIATKFINNLPNNKNWWYEKKRQKKIFELKKNYAFVSKYHINDWYKLLKR
jgi:putative transferase (TIGR04331 family)